VQGRAWPFVFAIVAALGVSAAHAQNLDEGKTAPQLFAGDCAACHKGPQGLGKNATVGFLRQHYTSSARSAALLAAYLAAAGGNPRGERQKAGQADDKDSRDARAQRKTKEKTAVVRPGDPAARPDRRKSGKSGRHEVPEPPAGAPPSPPAGEQPPAAALTPGPGEGTAAAPAAPDTARAASAEPAAGASPPSDTPASAEGPAARPPASAAASPPPPDRVADQPVFSTPLP
jgi:hypothetical protein